MTGSIVQILIKILVVFRDNVVRTISGIVSHIPGFESVRISFLATALAQVFSANESPFTAY